MQPADPNSNQSMSSNSQTTRLSDRRGKKTNAIDLANTPQNEQSGERRPYLLKMLQDQIGSYLLADTLDWDGESPFFFFFSLDRQTKLNGPPGVVSAAVVGEKFVVNPE